MPKKLIIKYDDDGIKIWADGKLLVSEDHDSAGYEGMNHIYKTATKIANEFGIEVKEK